ncbi:hypothetical protein Tco_1514414 [Tanacetum coccineum]
MDDPNITMEEYIKLQAGKAQRRGRTFNWETATYGKIYCDNLDFFTDFEANFPAIVDNDALTSNENVSPEPTLGGARCSMTERQFILSLGLHIAEEMVGDGFEAYWVDPLRRLCHMLISFSISRRAQAPEKVIATDLFYFRSMDEGTANVPYLLARYSFYNAEGRKHEARMSGGYFIGRLAEHFGLVSDEGLIGLTMVACELPLIDMDELVRLRIFDMFDDTWDWVALGPEMQQVTAAGAPEDVEGAHAEVEGDQAISALVQAPQPPPAAAQSRTMP